MKRIHSKEEIVQAGLEVILIKGYNGTGIEAILKQANVPKGSFYNFFASKEEFGLAVIDYFLADMGALLQPIMMDASLPPLTRIRRSFEALLTRFEGNSCYKGCLIANLGLEMADQCEAFRQRLEEALQRWADSFTMLLEEAQKEKALPSDLDPGMLAENMIASFEGAILRAKVKKSAEPVNNFLYLYFNRFLA